MLTEKISPRYVDLDSWSAGDMLGAMYENGGNTTHRSAQACSCALRAPG